MSYPKEFDLIRMKIIFQKRYYYFNKFFSYFYSGENFIYDDLKLVDFL